MPLAPGASVPEAYVSLASDPLAPLASSGLEEVPAPGVLYHLLLPPNPAYRQCPSPWGWLREKADSGKGVASLGEV